MLIAPHRDALPFSFSTYIAPRSPTGERCMFELITIYSIIFFSKFDRVLSQASFKLALNVSFDLSFESAGCNKNP